MTTDRPFSARPESYDANIRASETARVVNANIMRPDDTWELGITIFASGKPRLVLTAAAAQRIATQITAALGANNTKDN